jgi:hypothetical protein
MRELLDYRTLHWGTQPTGVENLAILDPSVPMIAVCELKACSYITVKAGKPEVYRHAFPKHDGRGPYLLKAKEPGDQEGEIKGTFFPPIPAKSGDSNSMGRLIDFEIEGGGAIATPFYWVATTPTIPFQPNSRKREKGGPVLLANRFSPLYAIEHRRYRGVLFPYILEHGIIG